MHVRNETINRNLLLREISKFFLHIAISILVYLVPNAVYGFADPEYWEHPESSEDVPKDSSHPCYDPRLRGVTY